MIVYISYLFINDLEDTVCKLGGGATFLTLSEVIGNIKPVNRRTSEFINQPIPRLTS